MIFMLPRLSRRKLLIASVATVVAAFAYDLLPERRLTLVPHAEKELVLFFDGKRGGRSRGYWDDQQASQAVCEINPGERFPYCGMLLSLGDGHAQGLDFSNYKGIRLNFKYSGPARRLRIFMRNHEPLFSEPGKIETAKFNNISVPVEDLERPIYLSLSDFSVAEWWQQASGVPRELAQPAFFNVVKFGFDLPSTVPSGRHELQLERLEVVGQWLTKNQWYLALLLGWVFVVVLWLVQNGIKIRRRLAKDALRLTGLIEAREDLSIAAETDPLTGVMSLTELRHVIHKLGGKSGNPSFAIALIDIDDFRRICSHYGHDAGNETLKAVSRILIRESRATDAIFRWSDDRFLLVASGTGQIELAVVAEHIRMGVHRYPFYHEGKVFNVSVSIGTGESASEQDFEQTFARANQALLKAKASGNTIMLSSEL